MPCGYDRIKLLATDFVAPINKTSIEGTDFTSIQVSLESVSNASVTIYAKGNNVGVTKAITVLLATYDSLRDKWDTDGYISLTITPSGTTAVQKTIALTPDVERIKILSIKNDETTTGYTVNINVSLFIKRR